MGIILFAQVIYIHGVLCAAQLLRLYLVIRHLIEFVIVEQL